jgi:hypothetical protein
MFRITTTVVTLATLALAFPGGAAAGPVEASAHLEAHAVADSGKALALAKSSAGRAKELVRSSEAKMKQAYGITVGQGQAASAQGLEASAQFSSSAQAQGDKLAELVQRSRGGLKAAAAKALAETGQMQATLVARLAKGIEQQEEGGSTDQAEGIGEVGADNASLTATIVVSASGQGLKSSLRRALERVGVAVRAAHGRLLAAVSELRSRSEGQGEAAVAQTQSSLEQDDCEMAAAANGSKRADASFSAQNGGVTVGDQTVADSGPSSDAVSATGDAHVAVNGEGGSC